MKTMKDIVVTTSLTADEKKQAEARALAQFWGMTYCERQKKSLKTIMGDKEGALVFYQSQLIYENHEGKRLFFHPDTAMLRIKAQRDPLLEIIGTGKKKILDCTMGLASDSLVMAAAGHQVTALESEILIHLLVKSGLQSFETNQEELKRALKAISPICQDSLSFLQAQKDKSFDILYFDPMFSQDIPESENLAGLSGLANPCRLNSNLLAEAKRVTREKIILKAHFRDPVFEDLGFKRKIRPNQKFHYGVMVVEKGFED